MLNDILNVHIEYVPPDPLVFKDLYESMNIALQEFEGLPNTQETRELISKRLERVQLDFVEKLPPMFKTTCEMITDEIK